MSTIKKRFKSLFLTPIFKFTKPQQLNDDSHVKLLSRRASDGNCLMLQVLQRRSNSMDMREVLYQCRYRDVGQTYDESEGGEEQNANETGELKRKRNMQSVINRLKSSKNTLTDSSSSLNFLL